MTFSIQFCFDSDSTKRINALWPLIDPRCSSNNSEPHLSVVNFEGAPSEELMCRLEDFASHEESLRLEISFIGVEKTYHSIMMLPVVTQKILNFHQRISELAKQLGIATLPHYQVGAWVPHITVTDETDFDNFEAALKVVLDSDYAKPVKIKSIRLIEFKPCRELC